MLIVASGPQGPEVAGSWRLQYKEDLCHAQNAEIKGFKNGKTS
jgi:hypothetical protein